MKINSLYWKLVFTKLNSCSCLLSQSVILLVILFVISSVRRLCVVEELSEEELDESAGIDVCDGRGVWIEGWDIDTAVCDWTIDVVLGAEGIEELIDWSRSASLLISSRFFLKS